MRTLALLALLLLCRVAHAQQPPCDPSKEDCDCERNWGCWELWYSSPGSYLGVKLVGSQIERDGHAADAAFLTTYATEHYGTRDHVTGHVHLFGSFGGGTAGSEGSVGGELDFGLRAATSPLGGPFVRAGPSGFLLGHRRVYLSMFEPLHVRAGYQWLDGDLLFEAGLRSGLVLAGRFEAAGVGERSLDQGVPLGEYVALHVSTLRFDASFVQLLPTRAGEHGRVDIVRGGGCSYADVVVLCAELLYATGTVASKPGDARTLSALYLGLTLGLSPRIHRTPD